MMTYDDNATIRNAIIKRLDNERGVSVCEVKIEPHLLDREKPFISVGVLLAVDSEHDGPIVRSVFHLPAVFEHRHLVNEIDEIAESVKSARIDMAVNGRMMQFGEQRTMLGSGLRGRWASYG